MQPLEDIFSSPEKTATMNVNMNGARTPSVNGQEQYTENEGDDSSGEDMDIENSMFVCSGTRFRPVIANLTYSRTATAPEPARLLGLKMPIPRGKSPVKTFLQSPAHKNPHLGASSSPVRAPIVEPFSREDTDRGQSAKRRLDFSTNGSARPVLKPTRVSPRTTRKGHDVTRDEEDDDEEAILLGQDETNGHDESMAMIDVDGGDDMPINGDDDGDVELGGQSRNEDVPQTNGHASRRTTRRSGRLSESLLNGDDVEDEDHMPEPDPEEHEEEEEEETLPAKPSPVQRRKRGRPAAKNTTMEQDDDEEDLPRRPGKRRRSNNAVDSEASEPPAAPEPKKAVGRPPGRKPAVSKHNNDANNSESNEASASTAQAKPKGKRGRPAKTATTARRSESPPAAGVDTSLAVIPRGPPLPKSKGLFINRRVEVPGTGEILRTRSGRNSFKPLAFWRNEHVDYDQDAAVDDQFARGGKNSRLLLPTVKEVVRVEEEETRGKKSGHKSKPSAASSKQRRKAASDSDFFDSEPAEPWEAQSGNIVGDAVVWRAEYDWAPPGLEEEVEVAPEQLAVSGQAIETREIRNATFRFAKTLSMPFFGAGVVDLPPGAEKRPKNSRKMYMAFFVFSGRVLVTVNESSFRISRGGMWFVPRGKFALSLRG
jgi:centromere protein C